MRSKTLRLIVPLIAVIVTCNAIAQSTEVPASVPATSAKSVKAAARAENRKLSHAVRRALAQTNGLTVTDIVVITKSGKVTLDGTVPEEAQVDRAGWVAAAVPNVKSLDNRLTIRAPGH